ncbi:hypothetical protein MJG53_014831 [Ovis ammon polii x Ovis aries]|uniref:Uncharacterized protein n=1 Tax=Ovis ammon polii x Ovis aries TaxID=2918886 RepID=A0ACB9UD45_9CETA|nr:hypothetical protein MJT46_014500 [Ovis ammon polii x Ovis aries]KAI4566154.1 hypothetical protein MJG53_014831 [Ovis ammon polii x Ovis aries]
MPEWRTLSAGGQQGGCGEEVSFWCHAVIPRLSDAWHLGCLGSQAGEITSEGQVVLFFSQKIGKRENPCPSGHMGYGCQRVLCARNTSLSSRVVCFTCGHCCCPAPGIQRP